MALTFGLLLVSRASAAVSADHDAATEAIPVYAGAFAPYATHGETRPTGLMVDILDALADEAGVRFDIEIMPWARAQLLVRQGEPPGMIVPLTRTPAREPHYAWVVPLLREPLAMMVTDPDLAKLGFADLRAHSVAVQAESPNAAFLKEKGYRSLDLVNAETTAARMLRHGRVAAWFARPRVARVVYDKTGGAPDSLHTGATRTTPPMYLGATPKAFAPALLKRIRDAFATLRREGRLDSILTRY